MAADFSRVARPYRWMEYLTFGTLLERCRFHYLPRLRNARRALVFGDGDGRFLERLLIQNQEMQADVVDTSPAMLRLLAKRARRAGAADRVVLHHEDALHFVPCDEYDLIVTHFFLDCLTTEDVLTLARRVQAAGPQASVSRGALWVVSDFAIPDNAARLPARLLVLSLYFAFRLLTGLRIRQLPDHADALSEAGFRRIERKRWLAGILISELWES